LKILTVLVQRMLMDTGTQLIVFPKKIWSSPQSEFIFFVTPGQKTKFCGCVCRYKLSIPVSNWEVLLFSLRTAQWQTTQISEHREEQQYFHNTEVKGKQSAK